MKQHLPQDEEMIISQEEQPNDMESENEAVTEYPSEEEEFMETEEITETEDAVFEEEELFEEEAPKKKRRKVKKKKEENAAEKKRKKPLKKRTIFILCLTVFLLVSAVIYIVSDFVDMYLTYGAGAHCAIEYRTAAEEAAFQYQGENYYQDMRNWFRLDLNEEERQLISWKWFPEKQCFYAVSKETPDSISFIEEDIVYFKENYPYESARYILEDTEFSFSLQEIYDEHTCMNRDLYSKINQIRLYHEDGSGLYVQAGIVWEGGIYYISFGDFTKMYKIDPDFLKLLRELKFF